MAYVAIIFILFGHGQEIISCMRQQEVPLQSPLKNWYA
jgi:hypothetical protein